MSIKLKLDVNAGGIFSKFMFVVQNLNKISTEFDLVYINNIDEKTLTGSQNIFDTIFDQSYDSDFVLHECEHLINYSKHHPIEYSADLTNYKNIVNKLKFTKEFNKKFNKIKSELNIDESFLGVHIRLCDMNITHGSEYGIVSYDDFLNEIKKHITTETKLFISSDNNETIRKLKLDLNNKIYHIENFVRAETEDENTHYLQLKHFKDHEFWSEAFIDMLLLSNCGKLICRSSNLNNASIIYSNTIKEVIRL